MTFEMLFKDRTTVKASSNCRRFKTHFEMSYIDGGTIRDRLQRENSESTSMDRRPLRDLK